MGPGLAVDGGKMLQVMAEYNRYWPEDEGLVLWEVDGSGTAY